MKIKRTDKQNPKEKLLFYEEINYSKQFVVWIMCIDRVRVLCWRLADEATCVTYSGK